MCLRLYAQPAFLPALQADSIQKQLQNKVADSTKVQAYYRLSRGATLRNTDEAIKYATAGLTLAEKINYPLGQISCLEALAFVYAISSNFDKGFEVAYRQMDLSRTHAPVREVFGINMMGLLYQKLGDDKASLLWAKKAYFHPKRGIADPFTQWSAKFLLAQEYERGNQLDSAYQYAQETLVYSKQYFPMQESYPTMILARISSKKKNYNQAIDYCQQIMKKEGPLGFFSNEVENELAQLYFENKNYAQAQTHAQRALAGGQQFKNYLVIMNASYLLSKILEKSNPTLAYQYLKTSITAKDTLTNIEKNKQVKILEIKEKQRVEELNLAEVYRKNELRFNTALGFLLSALVIASILFYNNRQKQKANRLLELQKESINNQNHILEETLGQLKAKNSENELLLKEIHHRVKNNLEVVSSLLALQSAKMDDPDMQAAMLASQNRVQSMGILHQKLYQSEHLAFIEMKNYFQNLAENILDSYNETERITVNIDMPEIEMDVDTAVPVGLIVNELLTNSLKYAFPNGEKGEINLNLQNTEKDNFILKLSDNGIGKPANEKAKGTGFGSQLVSLLTRQIEGKLMEYNDKGTMISIQFKRQAAA